MRGPSAPVCQHRLVFFVVALAVGVAYYVPLVWFRLEDETSGPRWGVGRWVAFAAAFVAGAVGMLWVEDQRLSRTEPVELWHSFAGAAGAIAVAVGIANVVTGRCTVGFSRGPLRGTRFHLFEDRARTALVGVVRAATGVALLVLATAQ